MAKSFETKSKGYRTLIEGLQSAVKNIEELEMLDGIMNTMLNRRPDVPMDPRLKEAIAGADAAMLKAKTNKSVIREIIAELELVAAEHEHYEAKQNV